MTDVGRVQDATVAPAGEDSAVGELTQQLIRLTRSVHRLKSQHAAIHGVEPAAYGLLFHLDGYGPKRVGALAEAVHADPSTVSRQVAQLVDLGLIERRPDPIDGRATVLVPTEVGLARLADVRRRRNDRMTEVLRDWSDDDLGHLSTLLDRFITDVEGYHPG